MSKLDRPDRVASNIGKLIEKHQLNPNEQDEILILLEQRAVEITQRRSGARAEVEIDEAEIVTRKKARADKAEGMWKPYKPSSDTVENTEVEEDDDDDEALGECEDYLEDPVDELRKLVLTQPGVWEVHEMLIGAPIERVRRHELAHGATHVVDEHAQVCDA